MSAFSCKVSWNRGEIKAFPHKLKKSSNLLNSRVFFKRENYPGKPGDAVRNKEQEKRKFVSKSKLDGLYKIIVSCGVQKHIGLKHRQTQTKIG